MKPPDPISEWQEACKEALESYKRWNEGHFPYSDRNAMPAEEAQQAIARATGELVRGVGATAHGGGNWRRIIEQTAATLEGKAQ